MAAVLMQSGLEHRLLQQPLTHAALGKKGWQTFVKCSFHKAAIVERSQDQNDNVDLATVYQQVSCSGCTVFVHRGGKNNTCTLHVCRCISSVGHCCGL